MKNYTEVNSRTMDRWVDAGWQWGLPISHDEYVQAQNGQWAVVLTPQKPVPAEWFTPFYGPRRLSGTKLLGLACGGGQQMPVFAALGAECTVLDYSERQLDSERMVRDREGYAIEIVKADMTKPLPFPDGSFDLIFHPVSNCYVEAVLPIWKECYRVLRKGGILLSGLDNGINYLFDDPDQWPLEVVNKVPFNPLQDPELYQKCLDLDYGIQFSHTLEEQIGGQLLSGFRLTHLYEDRDESPLGQHIPLYFATRSVKE